MVLSDGSGTQQKARLIIDQPGFLLLEDDLLLQAVMLIQHAWSVRRLWRVVPWWLLVFPRRGQAFPWGLRCIGMQRGQQALAGDVVEGQAVSAIGEVILYFLVALGELLDQGRGAVEVGNNLVLITVKTFLNVIQLTLRAVRRGIRQQAGNQETNGDTGNQGKSRQQPN